MMQFSASPHTMLIARRDDDDKPVAVWYLRDSKNNVGGRAKAGDGAGDMTSNDSRQRQHQRTAKQHGLGVNGTACCQQINSTEINVARVYTPIEKFTSANEKLLLYFEIYSTEEGQRTGWDDSRFDKGINYSPTSLSLLLTMYSCIFLCQLRPVLLLALCCIQKWCLVPSSKHCSKLQKEHYIIMSIITSLLVRVWSTVISMSACLSAHIAKMTCPNLTKFSVHFTWGCGSLLTVRRRCR